jgi:dipeptidyl aminopeptidase/acylaminoacyl peptidase
MQRASYPSVPWRRLSAAAFCFFFLGSYDPNAASAAQGTPEGTPADATYRVPDQLLVALADAPQPPLVLPDPQRHWLLELWYEVLPPITDLAQPELGLAGLRINPQTDGNSRRQFFTQIKLVSIADAAEHTVSGLPPGARISGVSWSPDSKHIVFTNTRKDGAELWVVEVAFGRARRLSGVRPSLILNNAPLWLADSRSLLCALVPDGRGEAPTEKQLVLGPVVQETSDRPAPARTYRNLLNNSYDEALFEYYLTVQLARIDLDGKVRLLGSPGLRRATPSPDGEYLLVETFHRPFSYTVPFERFPRLVEVWDANGVRVQQIADLALREETPITFDSVPAGRRFIYWRDDTPATLTWVEALDGGDGSSPADLRDRVYVLAAPFTDSPRPIASLAYRFAEIIWSPDGRALLTEVWRKTRRFRTWIVRPNATTETQPTLLFDRSLEDRYGDPGQPLTAINKYGHSVLRITSSGGKLFFIGAGASPEGERPFIDAYEIEAAGSRSPNRLFRSEAPFYEQPVDLLDDAGRYLLLRRESPSEPPNYFVRDLKTSALRQITFFPHPAPQLSAVRKEVIRYNREDGVPLSGTLYLPSGYQPAAGPLPVILWAYPNELKSATAAGQGAPSPYRFDQPGWWSPISWVLRGYAVLNDPGMPIIGAGDAEPNDTYVQQLVADAKAAVDELVRRGIADPKRIAICGHSYGATMVANLLEHSRLFAAGIALSGAYNRTLTPFGFQLEERTLWQAPEVYENVSPFIHADEITAPILIVHGQADDNPGTELQQSERFYKALKGLGAPARLVLLPWEGHSYRARESILHLLWEMDRWLDLKVKQKDTEVAPITAPALPPVPFPHVAVTKQRSLTLCATPQPAISVSRAAPGTNSPRWPPESAESKR